MFDYDIVYEATVLRAPGAATHFAEAGDLHTGLKLRLLLPREMKETQGQMAAAIADTHEQAAPAPVDRFGEEDFTGNHCAFTRDQRANPGQAGAILIA